MPEGDTIHRTAATLRAALAGRALTRVELPRARPPRPAIGAEVRSVEARGKHLLIATSDGLLVHTHLRMSGTWHVYPPASPWRRPAGQRRVVLGVDGAVAVCFGAPVAEVLDAAALRRHPALRALGPDLCDPDVDLDVAAQRLASVDPSATIGDALLDQRVACGIGNVYRCEVLFLHGLDPATPVGTIAPDERRALLASASTMLRANLRTTARTTVEQAPAGSSWVHGRGGRPCRRCGTAIEVTRQGANARIAYRCPRCQPSHAAVR